VRAAGRALARWGGGGGAGEAERRRSEGGAKAERRRSEGGAKAEQRRSKGGAKAVPRSAQITDVTVRLMKRMCAMVWSWVQWVTFWRVGPYSVVRV